VQFLNRFDFGDSTVGGGCRILVLFFMKSRLGRLAWLLESAIAGAMRRTRQTTLGLFVVGTRSSLEAESAGELAGEPRSSIQDAKSAAR
jgi:hypothetical protein